MTRRLTTQYAAMLILALLLTGHRPVAAGPPPSTAGCIGTVGDGDGLEAIVAAANNDGLSNVITLGTGCIYPITSMLTVGPDDAASPKTLTITGIREPGATIDAQSLNRVFLVQPQATLTLDHVTVTGGKPNTTSPPLAGGAIRNHHGTVNVVDSALQGNTAGATGGAVSNSGTLEIVHSTISGNTAGYGGAIHGDGSVTVRNSIISGNNARYDGGAILQLSTGVIEVASSTIAKNVARSGGGIFNYSGTANVRYSTITENDATAGGGGISNDGKLAINDSMVAGNHSAGGGGGIRNGGRLDVSDTTFLANEAVAADDAHAAGGGGLYNTGRPVTVDHSAFIENRAELGGGISNIGGPSVLTIRDSALQGNDAALDGGGIYTGGRLTLDRSQVTGNIADRHGGGVFSTYGTTVSKSRVAANTSAAGGGLYVDAKQGSNVTVTQSTLSDNTAAEGAGMYTPAGTSSNLDNPTVSVLRSTISGNDAALRGGGIFVSTDTSLTATNSTVSGNTASSGEGGGLYLRIATGVAKIWSSTITANEAATGGGIHNAGAAVAQVRNTVVALNPLGGNCTGMGLGAGVANLSDTSGCGPAASGFTVPAGPIALGPLAYNGGPTQTHPLPSGSPAINIGGSCPPIDQRGYLRTAPCDVGAFEV